MRETIFSEYIIPEFRTCKYNLLYNQCPSLTKKERFRLCNLTLRWKIKFPQSILCILGDFIFIDTNHNLAFTLNLSHAFTVAASISKKSTTGFTPFEARQSRYTANGTGLLRSPRLEEKRRASSFSKIDSTSRRKVRGYRMNNKLRYFPITDTYIKIVSHQFCIFNRY